MYDRPRRSRSYKHLGAAISSLLVLTLIAAPILTRAEVVDVAKDQPAPFAGLLLDEKTFLKYAGAEVDLASCRVEKAAAEVQVQTLARDKASTTSPPSSGYFWLGVGAGVVLTVVAVLGAAQLVKATK